MNTIKLITKLGNEIENIIFDNLEGFEINKITEIRLRVNQNVQVLFGNEEKIINFKVRKNLLNDVLLSLSDYSIYSIEEDLKKGFFTISGGHRIGVCGKVICENGNVKNISNVSSLIIRVTKEILGVSNKILKDCLPFKNILIISPPSCGKTTLLRDITRNLSNKGAKITVIDERSEISGMYLGEPQNDIGARTDILDSCPKSIGINMAIRTNNPNIVVLDEIGTDEDLEGLQSAFNSGVKILATVHSDNFESFLKKRKFKELIKDNSIDLYLVLSIDKNNKYIIKKYDKNLEVIC